MYDSIPAYEGTEWEKKDKMNLNLWSVDENNKIREEFESVLERKNELLRIMPDN